MRTLRSIIALVGVLVLTLSFSSCGKTDSASTTGTAGSVTLSQPDIKCDGADCIQ